MSLPGLAVLIAKPGTDREHLGGAHNARLRTSSTTEQRLTVMSGSYPRVKQYSSEQNCECNTYVP